MLLASAGLAAATWGWLGRGAPAAHPALAAAELPAPIPLPTLLAARRSEWTFRLSPDGQMLGWLQGGEPPVALNLRPMVTDGQLDRIRLSRPAASFEWAADSRHVLVTPADPADGRILVLDTADPAGRVLELTPPEGHRFTLWHTRPSHPREAVIAETRPDGAMAALLVVDVETGEQRAVATADDGATVLDWIADADLVPVGRIVREAGGDCVLQATGGEGWRERFRWRHDDRFRVVGRVDAAGTAWALSDRGRDTVALVRVRLADGAETAAFAPPGADVADVLMDRVALSPVAAWTEVGAPVARFFDPAVQAAIERLTAETAAIRGPAEAVAHSVDDTGGRLVVSLSAARHGYTYWLLDLQRDGADRLALSPVTERRSVLAETEPVAFAARDGGTVHGYLTLPRGTGGHGLPTVLLLLDDLGRATGFGYRRETQLLANRGYAVLQVNPRGLAGYGRDYLRPAPDGPLADLLDGLDWAVASGVADRERLALVAGGDGVAAGLDLLAAAPERFAAAALLATGPLPERAAALPASPPPLLLAHGPEAAALAARLPSAEVLAVAAAHGRVAWADELRIARALETLLARRLGGRLSGIDPSELMARVF